MVKEIITLSQYFGGNVPAGPLCEAARDLLLKVNSLLGDLGIEEAVMTSGYRSPEHNKAVGGSPKSNHCTGRAIDLRDPKREIGNKIMLNLEALQKRGMAMEDLGFCIKEGGKRWVHLQSVLPKSGRTIFIP